jgi:hypothetical protein
MIGLYLFSTIVGAIVIVWMLRLRRGSFGILQLSLTLIILQGVRDLGLGPLMAEITGLIYSREYLYSRASGTDALYAWLLTAICYGCIALGLIMVFYVAMRSGSAERYEPVEYQYSTRIMRRGWHVSLLFFSIGTIAQVVILVYLLPGSGFTQLASQRLIFTDERTLTDPTFNYIRMLLSLAQFGTMGMLAFAGRNKTRLFWAIMANLAYVLFEVLQGGRARVIMSIIIFLSVYHLNIRRIGFRSVVKFGVLGIVLFSSTVFLRESLISPQEAIPQAMKRLVLSESLRIDETAWLMNVFPAQIPFTGWNNAVGILARLVPGLEIEGVKTMHGYIINLFYRGISTHSGIGGANYSNAGELYSWGGPWCVAIMAFIGGIYFGSFFSWYRLFPQNKIVLYRNFGSFARCNGRDWVYIDSNCTDVRTYNEKQEERRPFVSRAV